MNWGDTRPKNQNSHRCCKCASKIQVVIPVAAVRSSRADRSECKHSPPQGRAPAQLTWTARRRGSWNPRPCNHNRVRDPNRGWKRQQPTCLHSHHEEGAAAVSCAGAIGGVCVWAQTQGAQDQTQEVTQHHQEDHTGHDQKYYPPGQAHTHRYTEYHWIVSSALITHMTSAHPNVLPDVLGKLHLWWDTQNCVLHLVHIRQKVT